MNKKIQILLFFLQFSLSLSAQGMIDDGIEVPSINSIRYEKPTYSIINNKPVATFTVKVASGTHKSVFWLQGVRHADGTYSQYKVWFDNYTSSAQTLTQNSADWDYTNTVSAYLPAGTYQLHVGGESLDDVPNVEFVEVYTSFITSIAGLYDAMKQHSQNILSPGTGYLQNFHFSSTENDPSYPPVYFTAERDKPVYYTFHRLEYYTAGQTVNFNVTALSPAGISNVINVFSDTAPSVNWVSTADPSTGFAILAATIDMSGFYHVLVRTDENSHWGTCSLSINGERYFSDVPVCCNKTLISGVTPGDFYASFALGYRGDPMLMLMNSTGSVIGFNDDYPYYSNLSDFDWGKNPRINSLMYDEHWMYTSLWNSYPKSASAATVDVYTGCDLRIWNYYSQVQPIYPNYKRDDIIVASQPSGQYNELSWAVGEWTFPMAYDYNAVPPEASNAELADATLNSYGFVRQGATEANAVIDLYDAQGDEPSHIAVKSKGHYYASGYAWESKLGEHERVYHPRYALESNAAGHVAYHYRRDPTSVASQSEFLADFRTIENASFTAEEAEMVEKGAESVAESVSASFDKLWATCQDEGRWRPFLSLSRYETLEHYAALRDLCLEHPETFYLVARLVDKGHLLAVKLLCDMTDGQHKELRRAVYERNAQRKRSADGKTIVRPTRTEAMLFMKSLLNGGQTGRSAAVSYSSDPRFKVASSGRTLKVSFDLDKASRVTVAAVSPYQANLQTVCDGQRMEEGRQSFAIHVAEAGVYVVTVVIDGEVFEKKVFVEK
ncbi:MAG: hypothetical protein IJ196_05055 [Prevotella sp.]|nr:hypothetical protein [Prevotella sp.]